jgi:acyl-coenzyme A synthetase/AMP-(fatty) acid ligase
MRNNHVSLWDRLRAGDNFPRCFLRSGDATVALGDLVWGSSLNTELGNLRGTSVLVAAGDQLNAAMALIELDGIARRLILCPPGLGPEHINYVAATGGVNAIVCDEAFETNTDNVACRIACGPVLKVADLDRRATCQTEWVLLTSGTTGMPKLVLHNLSSLTAAIEPKNRSTDPIVWSTFYDIRRYGGLQIFLRAVLEARSLVLTSARESLDEFLARAGATGVTNISGTPSHWRRALMGPLAQRLAPQYIRLSGELVDQAILDNLRTVYPQATIVHAFASTEAGVAFEVHDGLAGFPASLIGIQNFEVEMKVEDGSLRIRSPGAAFRYLGTSDEALADPDGFVDTRDMVELRGDRYYFVGRRDGVINVGGLKVHPEEVEAVINRHPGVRMSLVKARRNPITGALVVADVVAQAALVEPDGTIDLAVLRSEILEACRQALAPYKIPAAIRFVPSLEVASSGKLVRH